MFVCKRCGYECNRKDYLISHLNKIKECSINFENIDRGIYIKELQTKIYNDKNYKCEFCEKQFNNTSSKSRHKKTCNKKPQLDINELSNTVQILLKKNNELEEKINNISINTTNNTTNNTQNINITVPKLKNFGWENMEAIPESLISSLFMNLRFKELLANLHCDPNFPENQNVRIKSVKRNTMEIYRNNKWDIVTFTKGLTDLLLQGHKIFTDYYNKDKKRILEEDMDEQDLREILSQLQKIQDLNKSEIKPLIEDLQMMLEEYRENGHAIVLT